MEYLKLLKVGVVLLITLIMVAQGLMLIPNVPDDYREWAKANLSPLCNLLIALLRIYSGGDF